MMWSGENYMRSPGQVGSKSAPCSPLKPFQQKIAPAQPDLFHVIHKVPLGDSPYVKAKHVQLVDKDPDAAIALFWAAINAGDRVDSALKDMAIVMKQQNRPEEAIEAIKSLRYRCSDAAQESLDNVLLDLYKRCGRLDDQIALLKHKLHLIHQGMAFNGKRTKTARSQGKKFQVSIEQEATRLLGNLGWAYMQQCNFLAAEAVYRKALSIGPDNNKVCNLGICLMKQGRLDEAKAMLESVVPACPDTRWGSDSHLKSYERAQEMLLELEASMGSTSTKLLQSPLWQAQPALSRQNSLRQGECKLEQFVDISTSIAGALSATSGFGPASSRPGAAKASSTQRRALEYGNEIIGQRAYQSSATFAALEDYETDYSSPDENVDNNIQVGTQSQAPLLYQTGMRYRHDAHEDHVQPMAAKNLDSKFSFGAGLQRERSASNCGKHSSLSGSSENYTKDSFFKSGLEERIPLNNDSSNVQNAVSCEHGASKQITSGWGSKPLKSPLGNSELSFFSRWGYNEHRTSSTRRSLSLESFDTQLEQIALENEDDDNSSFFQGGVHLKRPRNLTHKNTPTKENVSVWGSLGFTQTPEALDFSEKADGGGHADTTNLARTLISESLAATTSEVKQDLDHIHDQHAALPALCEAEMKRQRRLRVFQEMTLFASSPQPSGREGA